MAEHFPEFAKVLEVSKGQIIYSPKMAKRIWSVVLIRLQKKDPNAVQRTLRSLRGTPELDKLVAKEIQRYKTGATK